MNILKSIVGSIMIAVGVVAGFISMVCCSGIGIAIMAALGGLAAYQTHATLGYIILNVGIWGGCTFLLGLIGLGLAFLTGAVGAWLASK